MRPLAKITLVGAGYVGAFALASAIVAADIVATSGPDRQNYAAMYDFGDILLFLAVFGVAAVVPSGAALYFLRPYRPFWTALSVAGLTLAVTAVAAFLNFPCTDERSDRSLVRIRHRRAGRPDRGAAGRPR